MGEKGERILDVIYDEVDGRLNPDGEECWYCGGEGETYDCIDGCCLDAERGCPDCARRCLECFLYAGRRHRQARGPFLLFKPEAYPMTSEGREQMDAKEIVGC
jgi:hypothetical protein